MKCHAVHETTPASVNSFDPQFWPVLVALTVLSGVAMGAVFTTLHEPWVWSILLVIPLVATLTIFLLWNLKNRLLRRLLRFAIVSSLALNLLILFFASIINVYQNPFHFCSGQVAQLRVGTIKIRDQQAPFVWQETNARPTPEPEIESERLTKPSAILLTQPVSVDESKPVIDTQLVRRPIATSSILRQHPMVSQLKRETPKLQPRSSNLMVGENVAESKLSVPSRTKPSESPAENAPGNIVTTKNKVRPLIEPTPESTATLPDSDDFHTNLQKPVFVSNVTVVKKPVIAPPRSIAKALASDAIEKVLRKRQRDSRLPDNLSIKPVAIGPDLARTVKPAAPTLTKPSVTPLKSVKPRPTEPKSINAKPPVGKVEPKVTDAVGAKPAMPPAKLDSNTAVGPEAVKKSISPFVSASGRVTLDGQDLSNAEVEFVPIDENGIRISVRTNETGQFQIAAAGTENQPGIKVAEYKIRVTTYSESPDDKVIDFLERVPEKYNSETELRATIAHDKTNHFDLNLSTK